MQQAFTSIAEKKLFQVTVAYLSLKTSLIIICGVALLVLMLYILSVLLSALFDVCQQIAQVYTACSPLEKLAAIFLTVVLITWIVQVYRRLHNATI